VGSASSGRNYSNENCGERNHAAHYQDALTESGEKHHFRLLLSAARVVISGRGVYSEFCSGDFPSPFFRLLEVKENQNFVLGVNVGFGAGR
jgi:hypothetical protein